jgi:RNA recognition motif-containing protein
MTTMHSEAVPLPSSTTVEASPQKQQAFAPGVSVSSRDAAQVSNSAGMTPDHENNHRASESTIEPLPRAAVLPTPNSFGSSQPFDEAQCNVYVRNISPKLGPDELRQIFEPFGEVASHKLMVDIRTGTPRGFGFVLFKHAKDAAAAVSALDGFSVHGRELNVRLADSKTRQPGEATNRVFLRNLPPTVSHDELVKLCSTVGTVHSCVLRRDDRHGHQTLDGRGNTFTAHVEMADIPSALALADRLNNSELYRDVVPVPLQAKVVDSTKKGGPLAAGDGANDGTGGAGGAMPQRMYTAPTTYGHSQHSSARYHGRQGATMEQPQMTFQGAPSTANYPFFTAPGNYGAMVPVMFSAPPGQQTGSMMFPLQSSVSQQQLQQQLQQQHATAPPPPYARPTTQTAMPQPWMYAAVPSVNHMNFPSHTTMPRGPLMQHPSASAFAMPPPSAIGAGIAPPAFTAAPYVTASTFMQLPMQAPMQTNNALFWAPSLVPPTDQ